MGPNSGTGESHVSGELEAQVHEPLKVVIAGGGVAGLEALLALSVLAEGLVDVELVSPSDEFVYRPLLVAEPFGNADVLRIGLEGIVRDAGAVTSRTRWSRLIPAPAPSPPPPATRSHTTLC